MKKIIRHPYRTGVDKLDRMIQELVQEAGSSPDEQLLKEMVVTVLKLQEDGMDRGDLKLINSSMKELRYALKVFQPYREVRKVAVFGSARTPKNAAEYRQASEFAKRIMQAGWMVITGASSGIMRAGNEGAGRAKSFGVNIRLPFEQETNPVLVNDPKLINFKYFFTRKLIFIKESDATVLCTGGFGTHDEGFETLTLVQTGKAAPRPIVCLDPPESTYWKSFRLLLKGQFVKRGLIDLEDIGLIYFTHDAQDAADHITRFYHNYHSSRYIGDRLVLRIQKPLTQLRLDRLNHEFGDILTRGKIAQHAVPFKEEENEPRILGLSRLSLNFSRRHFARLKILIERINEF